MIIPCKILLICLLNRIHVFVISLLVISDQTNVRIKHNLKFSAVCDPVKQNANMNRV